VLISRLEARTYHVAVDSDGMPLSVVCHIDDIESAWPEFECVAQHLYGARADIGPRVMARKMRFFREWPMYVWVYTRPPESRAFRSTKWTIVRGSRGDALERLRIVPSIRDRHPEAIG